VPLSSRPRADLDRAGAEELGGGRRQGEGGDERAQPAQALLGPELEKVGVVPEAPTKRDAPLSGARHGVSGVGQGLSTTLGRAEKVVSPDELTARHYTRGRPATTRNSLHVKAAAGALALPTQYYGVAKPPGDS
jgi:hypothetical protein